MKQKNELWAQEYKKGGIPSSVREEPSGSVVDFAAFLDSRKVDSGLVIDLGCGKGRNSLFLAEKGFEVYGLDFVCELVEDFVAQGKKFKLDNRIHGVCQSVLEKWPVDVQTIDIAIDTFCYKHQIDHEDTEFYRAELNRVLKPKAFYLLTLAGIDDGYYGPLLATSPKPNENVIIDPDNNIPSVLYSKNDVLRDFGSFLSLEKYDHKVKKGIMHGKEYLRSTHVFIFRKE